MRTIARMRFMVGVLATLLVPAAVSAAPSRADLSAITDRGRALYLYDAEAAAATDAFIAKAGRTAPPARGMYLGHLENDVWIFDFGTLSEDENAFSVSARATETSPGSRHFDVQLFAPPQPGPAFDQNAARAAWSARTDFGGVSRPYNFAVLPLTNGTMYVYVYPAQTGPIHPLGGDERYLVSADGKALLEKHRMHRAILEIPLANGPNGSHVVSGIHTDIFSDTPEDTDVFHVLIRRPSIPEYVGTQHYVYRINQDGSIDLIQTRP